MGGSFLLVMLALAAPPVETARQASTRLYVRTLPPGAEIILDGQPLGRSDGLFIIPPGVRRVTIEMDDYRSEKREVEALAGQITRVVVELKKAPPGSGAGEAIVADDGTAEQRRSIAGSGHAMRFRRPAGLSTVVAVEIFATRYGTPDPPAEDFTVSLLDAREEVIGTSRVPYAALERGELRWYRLPIEATEVPERFTVALDFNPHQTKGIFLGMDCNAKDLRSYTGLPATGFSRLAESCNWMIRPVLIDRRNATKQ